MSNYTHSDSNFKLIQLTDPERLAKRVLSIFSMWLSGRGVPEQFHEFITSLFVCVKWGSSGEPQIITTWRMALAVSPGEDKTRSVERAYNRLKKAIPKYFDWQSTQTQEIIHREIINDKPGQMRPKAIYSFPDYEVLIRLFSLPLDLSEAAIRAAVTRSIQAFDLPVPVPRKKRKKSIEISKSQNAKTVKEILEGTISPEHAGLELKEAWEKILDRAEIEAIKATL